MHLFIVDFEHGELDLIFSVTSAAGLAGSNPLENFVACNGNDTFIGPITDHRVTLARARLSVGKETAVIALPRVVKHLTAEALVNLLLIGVLSLSIELLHDSVYFLKAVMRPETVVERKGLLLASVRVNKLCGGTLHLNTTFRIAFYFSFVKGPDPNRNLDTHYQIISNLIVFRYLNQI